MKTSPFKPMPVLITGTVLALVCLVQVVSQGRSSFPVVNRLEWITYDWRVRLAARFPAPVAPDLGFVFVDDGSVKALLRGQDFPFHFGPLWPRQVYGFLIRELAAQGAEAVGFDVLFLEARPDHPPYRLGDGSEVSSDEFLARELKRCGNVILAAEKSLPPHDHFATNAWAVADISVEQDEDGVLRRVEAFRDLHYWHPLLREAADALDWDLERAEIQPGQVRFPMPGETNFVLKLDPRGRFRVDELQAELTGERSTNAPATWEPAVSIKRAWQIGILLAAHRLKLDLDRSVVDLEHGRVVLKGAGGIERVIPVDHQGRFLTDWRLTHADPELTKEGIQWLIWQDLQRQQGRTADLTNRWKDKLVVVGSIATGGNMTDLGTTPLEKGTYLIGQHWNVVNSVLLNRFIQPSGLWLNLGLVFGLGAASALLTWRLRAAISPGCVLALAGGYVALAAWAYVRWRWWLPMALPVAGSLMMMHASLVTYKAMHEQAERRRLKGIFSKMVSPAVVNELLRAERLALGGAQRAVTMVFADIRGFTQYTDENQAQAEEYVRQHQLPPEAAERHLETQARELLRTVNDYLSLIAQTVKDSEGTLDKYIGDCVMAFWGAPTPNPKHALSCVRAMIAAQRAIHRLNEQRRQINARREAEQALAGSADAAPRAPLRLLSLGIGINSGLVTVGLMGSEEHGVNYTVFGREVNLASRVQGQAGPDRIVITQATLAELQRDDPALAAQCVALPAVMVKGIHQPVPIFEVPWQSVSPSPKS